MEKNGQNRSIMRIYIAGALGNGGKADAVEYIRNVSSMMHWAEVVRELGHAVFVPSHDLLMGIKFGGYVYSDYFDNNLEWLKVADAVFVCPNSEDSTGTMKEILTAKELGIPIWTEKDVL